MINPLDYETLYKFFILLLSAAVFSCDTKKENQDEPPAQAAGKFKEPHRPQFHFSPDSMWMNDPNGMVYYDGEYHLFYQYYPDSTVWGPMHWGHAVSSDLMHWEHLSIALYPDELGYIFSGSAVADTANTSGLGTDENPPLVAIYTYHDPSGEKEGKTDYQTQGIAYSLDKGRSWTKYEHNPVLSNPGIRDFRDPKVMWYAPMQKWIMTLAVDDHVSFYSSPNLIEWTFESDFGADVGAHGGVWECPDLFELPVEGSDEKAWVLLVSINPGGPNGGSATQYFTGEFDGSSFVPSDTTTRWLDYGMDNYAGVTFSNVEDRKVLIGWMSNWVYAQEVPTEKWRSAMTLPRTLTLAEEDRGKFVKSVLVEEFSGMVRSFATVEKEKFGQIISINEDLGYESTLFTADIEAPSKQAWKITFSNDLNELLVIGFDPGKEEFYTDRSASGENKFNKEFFKVVHAPRIASSETIKVKLVVDLSSVEMFADDGLTVMTNLFFPEKPYERISFEGVDIVSIASVRSVW